MLPRTALFCILLAQSLLFARDGKVDFVAQFYRAYLDSGSVDKPMDTEAFLAEHPFFTQSAARLLDSNHAVCAKYAGSDVCGYDADHDIFLSAQEFGPDLSFATSGFTARTVSSRVVEVAFSVWPGKGAFYDVKLQLVLAREDGRWRVDDIVSPDSAGVFKSENSMRSRIREEIRRLVGQ